MREKALYVCEGKVDASRNGWSFEPSGNPGGQVYNEAEGYYPDKGGKLLGPAIALGDGAEFISISFDAKAAEDCHWGCCFQDRNGADLVADVYSSIYGGQERSHCKQVVYNRESAVSLRLFFQSLKGVEVWDLRVERMTGKEAADWCDSLYQTLPPLLYTPPEDRLKRLPQTVDALKTGRPWRVVMLGDSIVNDTFNSNFQALVKRAWPASDAKFICSVRGSTGCWHYQLPENFRAYVESQRPDLLVVGGISHKGDIEAIRRTLQLAKERLGCELLLLSGPLDEDWRRRDDADSKGGLPAQVWTPKSFPKLQRQLAEGMKVEFLDMAEVWHNYLGASTKPWQWFHRDRVHGNDRGKQIVGRTLAKYLSK